MSVKGRPNYRGTLSFIKERYEEEAADTLMQTLGFVAIRLSQRRASQVTRGLPDRLYLHPTKRLSVWYECKSETGKQSVHQKAFQDVVESSGGMIVVGPCRVLGDWCVAHCLAHRTANGNLIALRAS